jgi:phosphoglycolate phosphatase
MSPRARFVVFDWDGTLADSTGNIARALQAACADVAEPVPDDRAARYVIGLGLLDALRHLAPGLPKERHGEIADRYRHHYFAGDARIALFEGARELLTDLAANGAMLAIATGKTRVGLDRALAHQGDIGKHFAATRCADEGRPKPHADMLLHLMDRVKARPDETIMIGDTTHDLELARNAGVASIGVSYGAHDAADFPAYGPVGVVASLRELRPLLLG